MTGQRDTAVVISSVMLPAQANPHGNVHGGEILKLMDSTAGCTAVKFARVPCVTARMDEVQFHQPVHISDFVACTGRVVYTGRTSIEVYVTVDVEDLCQEDSRRRALDAYFTMVALGPDGRPTPVPEFTPAMPEERDRWEAVQARREASRQRRGQAA
jgi:acyl-CoA hydrolase